MVTSARIRCWGIPISGRLRFDSLLPTMMSGASGLLHADDVVAGVHVMNLAGHAARQIGQEIDRGVADLFDRHVAAQRRVILVPLTGCSGSRRCRTPRAS